MTAVVARVPMPRAALFLNSGGLRRGSGEAGLLSWWRWRSPDQVRTVGHMGPWSKLAKEGGEDREVGSRRGRTRVPLDTAGIATAP